MCRYTYGYVPIYSYVDSSLILTSRSGLGLDFGFDFDATSDSIVSTYICGVNGFVAYSNFELRIR